ncbi:MAG: radical SAM protein [Deltaproteobacteria bacterium]|nr:radical SAM protein [Deltaproteobacteria bacterium]
MASQTGYSPSLVSWNLTRACNLRCPHCYMEGGRKAENELTTEECLALITELDTLGTEMLILTGGEPLLRKDIFEIATSASSLGIWVVLGTNGVMVNVDSVRKMIECGVQGVAISIDSIEPEKHNQFRGGPDAWEHSVRALEICRANGLQVVVQTTVMDMNYAEIPELLEFAREKGAWSFNLYFLVQTGRGQLLNDLSSERTENMLSDLVDWQEKHRPMLVRSKCAPQFKQIAYERGLGGLESGGCMAGTGYCRITPQGDVTPCPYMTVVAGNVREQSFGEIWRTSPVLQELRDVGQLKGRCGRCEFNELCGGCRCRAYAAFGDYLQEDPACRYQPTGQPLARQPILWSEEAQARLERIPIAFVREKVKQGVEAHARRHGANVVTPDVMKEALAGEERSKLLGKTPAFLKQAAQRREGLD